MQFRSASVQHSGPVTSALTGPVEAVAESRARVHHLATMGAELERVVDSGDALDSTIDDVATQLESVRAVVIDALRMISQVQLPTAAVHSRRVLPLRQCRSCP